MLRGIGRLRAKASGGGSPGDYLIDAADFDGTNDYMTRGAALTGIASSKLVTGSLWVADDTTGTGAFILGVGAAGVLTGYYFYIQKTAGDIFNIVGRNSAGTIILDVSSSAHASAGTWFHILFSFDLANAANRHLYINDVSELTTVTTYTNDTIAFATPTNAAIGARTAGTAKLNGGLAQVSMLDGVYIDLSVQANRRKFISATGKPVDLGSDGSTAYGAAARILQNLADGGTASDFATNAGNGGSFTVTGALTTYATSPSD